MPARGRPRGQGTGARSWDGRRATVRPGAGAGRREAAGADPRDDGELLRAHVAGDPRAFEEVVRRHSPRLWALAAGVLRDGDEAADALQDAFVSALRGASTFRGDAAVGTWLHRIVVNACLDRLRRSRARPTVPLDAPTGSGEGRTAAELLRAPGDPHAGVETEVDVRAALAALPEHQRAALVLVDLHDMPVAEAAAVLGVAVGTVKSRCARGRAAMADLLRARGLDPRPSATDAGGRRAEEGAPVCPGNPAAPHDVPGDGDATSSGRRRSPAPPPTGGPPQHARPPHTRPPHARPPDDRPPDDPVEVP
ncbi:RNA polymerase sigma factor SigM [Pseudokineococcus basanitobsidens]|uniref:RNA polymerase sigma factor SigM n=1 Tax=Pseudokineococcus basanitobsidens TaxID=1926649 RepID=A0ABU8RLB3_9ACTN